MLNHTGRDTVSEIRALATDFGDIAYPTPTSVPYTNESLGVKH